MTKYRKGSMGAAHQKSTRIFCAVASVLIIIVASLFHFNLFDTFAGEWYAKAYWWDKVISAICFSFSIYCLWRLSGVTWDEKGAKNYGLVVALLVIAGVLFAASFNFSL